MNFEIQSSIDCLQSDTEMTADMGQEKKHWLAEKQS